MLEELERVRAYRADVPEPDAAAVTAARLQLMEAMERESAAAAPQRRRSKQPFSARLLRHDEAERQRSARSSAKTSPRPRARLRTLQRRRRFALAGALATVGMVLAGVFGFDTAAAPQSALAAQMNQLAKVAASQDWTGIPGPGQYLYTESEGLTEADTMANGKECSIQLVQHRSIWTATDGSGALSEHFSGGRFTSGADASVCASMNVSASSENVSGGNRYPAGGLSFPTNDWKSLSTDPSTLLRQVHQRDGGPDTPAEWFVNVTDFLRESDVPPAIRAALYQALPLIAGVKLLGPQSDVAGQSGLGVGFFKNGQLSTKLIFDQQTGRLLFEEDFDTTGAVAGWTAYTAQKIVDSVPNYPMESSGPSSSEPSSSGTATPRQGQSTTTTGSGMATGSAPLQAPGATTTGN